MKFVLREEKNRTYLNFAWVFLFNTSYVQPCAFYFWHFILKKWQRLSIRNAFWLLLKYDYPTTKCRYKANLLLSYIVMSTSVRTTTTRVLLLWLLIVAFPFGRHIFNCTAETISNKCNLPTSVSDMSKTSRTCLSFPTAFSVFLFLFSHLSFPSKMIFSKPSLLFKWPKYISFCLWRSVTIALIFHFESLPNWRLFCAQSMILLKLFYSTSFPRGRGYSHI